MKLDVLPLSLSGVRLIRAKRYLDPRGYFAETYVRRDFADAGIDKESSRTTSLVLAHAAQCAGCTFRFRPSLRRNWCASCAAVSSTLWLTCDAPRRVMAGIYPSNSTPIAAISYTCLQASPTVFALCWPTLRSSTRSTPSIRPSTTAASTGPIPALGIAWPVSEAGGVLSPKDAALPALRDLPDYFD